MVDLFLSKLSQYRQSKHSFATADSVVQSGSFHYVSGSTKLIVILPYWHARPSRFAGYRARLHSKGISTLYFDLEPRLLHADVERVIANFSDIAKNIVSEVQALQKEFGLPRLGIDAFSLGNTLVGLLQAKLQAIETLRLVVPGDSLAACVWEGIATTGIRTSFEKQGISEDELVEAWKGLAPITYAAEMARTIPDIYITLAKADKFIPYHRGKKLVRELQKHNANLHLQEWRLGHGASVLRYIRLHSGQTRKQQIVAEAK